MIKSTFAVERFCLFQQVKSYAVNWMYSSQLVVKNSTKQAGSRKIHLIISIVEIAVISIKFGPEFFCFWGLAIKGFVIGLVLRNRAPKQGVTSVVWVSTFSWFVFKSALVVLAAE